MQRDECNLFNMTREQGLCEAGQRLREPPPWGPRPPRRAAVVADGLAVSSMECPSAYQPDGSGSALQAPGVGEEVRTPEEPRDKSESWTKGAFHRRPANPGCGESTLWRGDRGGMQSWELRCWNRRGQRSYIVSAWRMGRSSRQRSRVFDRPWPGIPPTPALRAMRPWASPEAQEWASARPCPRRVDVRSRPSRSPVLRRSSWKVQLLIPWMILDYTTSRGEGSWQVRQARGYSLGSFHLPIADKPWWTTDPAYPRRAQDSTRATPSDRRLPVPARRICGKRHCRKRAARRVAAARTCSEIAELVIFASTWTFLTAASYTMRVVRS